MYYLLLIIRAVSILLFFMRSTGVHEAILLRHIMLLFGVSASNYAPFLGVKYADPPKRSIIESRNAKK